MYFKIKSLLLGLLFFAFTTQAQILKVVSFTNGAMGVKAGNNNGLTSLQKFSTLNVTKAYFIQNSAGSIYSAPQGNDVPGSLRIFTIANRFVDIPGNIVWRETRQGNNVVYFGFNPTNTIQNAINLINFGGANFQIDDTKSIAIVLNGETVTFTDGTPLSGNAAGVLDDLNTYLSTTNTSRPQGPVTVNAQTTSNTAPTITGTVTLGANESLSVEVNGVVYSTGTRLTVSGTSWTLSLPLSAGLTAGNTYNVAAVITNNSGFTLEDNTSGELVIQAPTASLTVSGTGTANTITKNVQTAVDPGLTVAASENITNFTVSITDSYQAGDILSYTGSLPSGVTVVAFNTTTRSIIFRGTKTAAEWQEFLRRVTLTTPNNDCLPERRKVTFVAGETYYNPLNGHFYRPISTTGTWLTNKIATQSLSYYGRQGYLVTLTSESENSFVSKFVGQDSWIGCSDNYLEINEAVGYTKYADQNAAEGFWHWVTGPEKGTQMRNGNAVDYRVGSVIAGVYQNWASNEPNDWQVNGVAGNEDYGHMYANNGTWNDFPNSANIRSIYEFGDMPNDNTSATPFFTRDIAVQGSSSGRITGGEVSVCSGTNSTTLTLTNFTGTVTRWESSFDNFITAGTAINNTALTYTATNLTRTTYFRAVVSPTTPSGCTGLLTPSTAIMVTASTGGNILATGGNTICQGGEVELVLSGNSGTVQKWQKSTDNTNWSDINNTTINFTEVLNTVGTFYYRAVVTNSCNTTTNSGSITVTVQAGTPPVGGAVSSASHNSTTNSGTLTLSGHTGTVQKWQRSEDNGLVWIDITNTTTSQAYSNISKNTLYRARLQSGSCGFAFSAAGEVAILLPTITVTGSLNAFNTCSGTASTAQTFSVSGANLTADISIAAVTGYEYSLDGTTYASTLTLPKSGTSVSNTTISVRLASNASGTPSGIIYISSTGATTRAVSVSGTVNNAVAPTGNNASRYGTGTVVISASVANGNTVDWYAAATGGNALASGATSFTTPSISQTTTYYAQTRNVAAGCISTSRTAVTASVLDCSEANPNVQFRLSAPNVTTASIQGNAGTRTESFNAFSLGNLAATGTFAVGSFTKSTTGNAAVKADDVWGGSGSQYLQIASGGSVSITLTDPSRYVGFWWGAGNADNNVTIYGSCGGNEIALGTFTTQTVLNLLAGSTVKAVDGASYSSSLYRRLNAANEPFAYVNLQLDDPNIYFTRIVFSGSGFEFDNVTTSIDWGTVSGLSVTSFSPIPAKSGETITINGAGFTGTSAVRIGGVNARSFTVVSATQITAIVPANATTNTRVTVTNDGVDASLGGFVFDCSSNALDFDGTNDHVVLGDVIESFTTLSQEAWVFWKGSSAAHSEIFSKEVVSAMSITNDNKLHANFGNGSSWGAGVNSATTIPLNKWTHVAITRSSSGIVKLYINGVLDANSATLNLSGGNSLARAIGAKYTGANTIAGAFNGLIDELKVWNTERTAAQITAGLGTEMVGNESGLIAYYNFNQGTAAGTNSTITALNNLIPSATPAGTLTNFTRSGTASNFVIGVWPVILTQPSATLALCTNSTTGNTLTVNAVGQQLSYQWYSNTTNSNSGGTAINGANAATYPVPSATVGTLYYYVVVSSACSSTSETSTVSAVTVSNPPVAGTLSGTQDVCVGATTTFASTVSGGVWTTSNANIASVVGSTGVVSGVAVGTATITYTVSGCTNATATRTVTVTAAPLTPTLSGTQNACVGGTTQLTASGGTPGVSGTAMNFDGVNDRALIPDNNTLDITNAITIEAWVNPSKNTGIQNVLSKSSTGPNDGYIFPRTDDGWRNFVVYLHIGGSWRTVSHPYPALNTWHHLAATYDGSRIRLYLNGTLVNSVAASGAIAVNNNFLAIGDQPGFAEYFGGSVDELRLWNVARTQAQIAANKDVEISAQANLIAYFNFNQGVPGGNNTAITNIQDASGNAFNAAIDNNFALNGQASNFISYGSGSGAPTGTWTTSDANIATVNSSGLVTGVATGTATITYTVAGSGGCADATATRTVTINPAPAIAYGSASYRFERTKAITAFEPTSTGATVASYAISPELPAGLSFNTTTGAISGTPTAVVASATYTVTATTAASCTATATFTLETFNAPAPTGLSYNPSTQTVRRGTAINNMPPITTGGPIETYTINPALPAGLTISASTGIISGTLTAQVTGSVTYTVTGSNTGGSVTATVTLVYNTAPTDIGLSPTSVPENEAIGTTVGTLTVTDIDEGDTHTYTLVSGDGDTDNASFTIDGTSLKTNAVFDFETKTSYSIRIRVTDAGGLSYEEVFTITVTDVDEDNDGDGVMDSKEREDGTDPFDRCSFKLTSQTVEPSNAWKAADCDNDGLTNQQEKDLKTDPLKADTDGDGVIDGKEVSDNTDPLNQCSFVLASQTVEPSNAWKAADCDNDGLTNQQEKDLKTDPLKADTDGDGVIDGKEVSDNTDPLNQCSFVLASQTVEPSTAWKNADCDNDGLTNQQEKDLKTDPLKADTDGDGVIDGKEVSDNTDPLNQCSFVLASQTVEPSNAWKAADCDNDGLTNQQEKDRRTDPLVSDSDGDGVIDGKEVSDNTDPLNQCSFVLASQTVEPSTAWKNADCDNDGLTNQQEKDLRTDPLVGDSDGDGVLDGREVTDGTNPLNQCSLRLESQTVTPSQAWLNGDCNGDGIRNGQNILISMYATRPQLQSDGSYNLRYIVRVRNLRPERVTLTAIQKNLANVFTLPSTFRVTGVRATGTGHLTASSTYDGRVQLNVLGAGSGIGGYTLDSVMVDLNLAPNGFAGNVNSTATVTGTGAFNFSLNIPSTDTTVTGGTYPAAGAPTPLVIPKVDYIIPDAFSPNRDGINDRFVVIRPYQSVISLQVFNRWGNVVYRNENYNNEWDGRGMSQYGAGDLPEGTYFYIIRSREPNGQVKQFKGSIMLKRN